jgi:hypothetical protein
MRRSFEFAPCGGRCVANSVRKYSNRPRIYDIKSQYNYLYSSSCIKLCKLYQVGLLPAVCMSLEMLPSELLKSVQCFPHPTPCSRVLEKPIISQLVKKLPAFCGTHPLSAVRYCLFNTFATTLHIWKTPAVIESTKYSVAESRSGVLSDVTTCPSLRVHGHGRIWDSPGSKKCSLLYKLNL